MTNYKLLESPEQDFQTILTHVDVSLNQIYPTFPYTCTMIIIIISVIIIVYES